jgi:hypothetical protein
MMNILHFRMDRMLWANLAAQTAGDTQIFDDSDLDG